MHRRQPVFLLSFICACAVALPVAAQQETATLTGTVRDDSGAVVQHARVTVTNVLTNTSAHTETDDGGFYRLTGMRPGRYTVTTELAGFSLGIHRGIILQIDGPRLSTSRSNPGR